MLQQQQYMYMHNVLYVLPEECYSNSSICIGIMRCMVCPEHMRFKFVPLPATPAPTEPTCHIILLIGKDSVWSITDAGFGR